MVSIAASLEYLEQRGRALSPHPRGAFYLLVGAWKDIPTKKWTKLRLMTIYGTGEKDTGPFC
jgi:hypothetical protein